MTGEQKGDTSLGDINNRRGHLPRPIPVPDEVSKPFWDACNEQRLIIQNCKSCDRMQYPPEKLCSSCGSSEDLDWVEVSGK